MTPLGSLVPIRGVDHRYDEKYSHQAFVPDALPTTVELSTAAWAGVTAAQGDIARLDGAAGELPDPMLLVAALLRREAVTTSALEGTHTGFGDLLQAEVSGREARGDTREVLNYVHAAEQAIADLQHLPVCMRLLHDAHHRLLDGVRGDSSLTGTVRPGQNWIGPDECRITEATFVPPPADQVPDLLADWERWIHRVDLPVLVRVAMGHVQFETIHPYVDGNGRIGRLAILLQLIEEGLLRHHLLALSGVLERDRDTYIGQLERVRKTGDWSTWVQWFSLRLGEAARESHDRIIRAQDLTRRIVDDLRQSGQRGSVVQVAEGLVGHPVMTAPDVQRRLGVSYQTANEAIAKLVDQDTLVQVSEGNYNRTFASLPMIAIFS